jgi:guanylate kinase
MAESDPATPLGPLSVCSVAIPNAWPYPELLAPPSGLLVVLSGPSGVGKDAVIACLRDQGFPFTKIVTATTRAPRDGEADGRDYRFLSHDEFARKRDAGQFLEWANVYGTPYGTPVAEVRRALDRSEVVLLKIDVQGAAQIKAKVPNALFIYLGPESFGELERRLVRRGTETDEEYQVRLEQARNELRQIPEYDYLVINRRGQLACAAAQVVAIITAERLQVHPRRIRLPPV